MAATIGTSHVAARQQWLDELMLRHLNNNSLAPLMGTGDDAVIRIMNVENRAGDTFKVHFSDMIANSEWVEGDSALSGIAESLAVDNITINRKRVARKIENFAMSQQRTIVDLERELVMPKLEEALKSKVQSDIMTALCTTTSGRSQNRYLYGAAEANYNATHATALANVDNSADKLTLQLISRVKRKAQLQGAGVGKIKPAKIKLKDGRYNEQNYILLAHSWAIRDLKADSTVTNQLSYRDNQDFNLINGASFFGMFDGVLIYEMFDDEMLETNSNSVQCAHNLLLGAGAAVQAYGKVQVPANADNVIVSRKQNAMVTSEVTDHAGDAEYGLTTVMGSRKLVNSSSEDNGVVHLFTAAVGDA